MRIFINMSFICLITTDRQNEISLKELQVSYNEFIDAIVGESFTEPEQGSRYNALVYTLIELKYLQKEIKDNCDIKKKCNHNQLSIQSNRVCDSPN